MQMPLRFGNHDFENDDSSAPEAHFSGRAAHPRTAAEQPRLRNLLQRTQLMYTLLIRLSQPDTIDDADVYADVDPG